MEESRKKFAELAAMTMAEASDFPFLTDPAGREHPLAGPVTAIGRSVENDVVITSQRVWRDHARSGRRNRRITLEDAGNTNGTFLNGEQTGEPVDPADGDRIAVGGASFVFRDPETALRDSSAVEREFGRPSGIARVDRRAVSLSPREFLPLAYR